MTKLYTAGRALFALLALAALSACTVFSQTPLVSDSEVATPLDPSFALVFYTEEPDGYTKGDDDPQPFTLTPAGYEAGDKSMTVRFVPLEGNQYLLAVNMQGGNLYGVARIFDNHVLEVHLVLDEAYQDAIKAKLASAPADISGAIAITDAGVEAKTRPALDFLVQMLAAGEIGQTPMIGYIAPSATDPFPSAITKDGDGWSVTN
ncbi:MAG TPA: hypothetical protein VG757_12830 [Devosia sp.]|nr:hypothetical protein [Devosia sp.]